MSYSSGKCAVVTGAGSGIGRALAQLLNAQGCELYISDIDTQALEQTKDLLDTDRAQVHTQKLDVADRKAVHAWADGIGQERPEVDIVINNAGVGLGATVEEMRYEDLDWLMGVNFWGVIQGTMAFLPLLRKSRQGHLVNISSAFGIIALPTQSAYNAAKFGVRGFTESLRQELQDSNVHVCCVHPGGIKTNIARNSRGGDLTADERDARFRQIALTTADAAAEKILRAIEKKKPRLTLGIDAKIISLVARLFPVHYPVILRLNRVLEE